MSINPEKNDKGPADNETVKDISKGPGKGPRVLICQTNEQVSCADRAGGVCLLSRRFLPLSLRWRSIVFVRGRNLDRIKVVAT